MEKKAYEVDGFLARPDAAIRLFLLFGPDGGLVRERAGRLARHLLGSEAEPFQLVRLEGATLADDPARLADEAGQIGMFGGERVIRVTDGAAAPAAVEAFLENPAGAAVIVEAGDLRPTHRLRKLCRDSGAAAALPCYPDDAESLERLVDGVLREAGLRIDPGARSLVVERLGPDRGMNRSMLELLVLYKGDTAAAIGTADVEAVLGDSSAVGFDDIAFATLGGETAKALQLLDKAVAEKTPSVLITGQLLRQLDRFDELDAARAEGKSLDAVLRSLRLGPRAREAAFRRLYELWPVARRARAREMVVETDLRIRGEGLGEALACRDLVLRLATAARRGPG